MAIEVVNQQRRRRINTKQWRQFGEQALRAVGASNRSATIVFVPDKQIKELNRRFRGKDSATDVLSFPSKAELFEAEFESHLGDVVISVDRVAAQAGGHGLSFSG